MAANALRNYDVDRALDLLEQIRATCDPDAGGHAVPIVKLLE
jgi:hypothetical protein